MPGGWWIVDPDTKTKISANSYRNLLYTWKSHREGNGLNVNDLEYALNEQICERVDSKLCKDSNVAIQIFAKSNKDLWGPKLWEELHVAAKEEKLTLSWLLRWESQVPSFGCSCRDHWKSIRNSLPFQPTFEWTWKAHNLVNEKVGHPQLSLEDAQKRWGVI